MIGIPYRLVRESAEDGVVDKTIYLATRRSGEAGEAMRKARRTFDAGNLAAARAMSRYQSAERLVKELAAGDERVPAAEDRCDAMLVEIQAATDRAQGAAEKLVLLSLTEVYGRDKAAEILDGLTDTDIQGMVIVIATGEQPEDFFPSRAPRPRSTTTSPSGGSPPTPSSDADSPSETSGRDA